MFLHKKDMDWTRILQTDKQEDSYIPPPQILFVGEGG